MTTADETKKIASSSEDGATPPKKRKRKRKAKKVVTTTTVVAATVAQPTTDVTSPSEAESPASASGESSSSVSTTTAKPNIDIKSDDHMLPGIEDIHAYIARTKSSQSDKKEQNISLVLADGTDLTQLPGVYAIVPHTKGDHKIVYMTSDAPEGLLDDPRNRVPGEMYVKNGRNIYMVTLTMKEHPTLKDPHGEAYDVWLIDSPEQLTNQLQAIKAGVGGGDNFGEPIILSSPTTVDSSSAPESATETVINESITTEATPDLLAPSPTEVVLDPIAREASTGASPDSSSPLQAQEEINTTSESPIIEEAVTSFDLPPPPSPDTSLPEELSLPEISLPSEELSISVDDIDLPEEEIATDNKLPEVSPETTDSADETVLPTLDLPSFELPEDTLQEPALITQNLSSPIETTPEGQNEAPSDSLDLTMNISAPENNTTETDSVSQPSEDTPITEEAPLNTFSLDPIDPIDPIDTPAPDESSAEEALPRESSGSFLHPSDPDITSSPTVSGDTGAPEEGHMRFGSATDNFSSSNTQDTPVAAPNSEPGSMFRAENTNVSTTSVSEQQPTESTHGDTPRHTLPTTEDAATEETHIVTETVPETPTDTSPALDLDDLHIDDTPASSEPGPTATEQAATPGTVNLDTLSSEPEIAIREVASSPKKFPLGIIIRIVLFFVIIGALILIWKVMFPAIKGSKTTPENSNIENVLPDPVDTTSGSVQDTDNDNQNTIPPTDDAPDEQNDTQPTPTNTGSDTAPKNNDSDTPNPLDDTKPTQLTLPELQAKLETQQMDARKLLNVAKLLEQKQAIKFSLAAMLKAGNVLERIETEPTITAEDVLQESQKIDAYLSEASKLVE